MSLTAGLDVRMTNLRNEIHKITGATDSILLEVGRSLNTEVLYEGVGQLRVRGLRGVRQGSLHCLEWVRLVAGMVTHDLGTNRSGTNQAPSPKRKARSVSFTTS